MKTTRTDLLEIAFEEGGPDNGRPVLLLHGWPDAPCGWNGIAPQLHAGG
jgi:pimeloyl-ACP methyl ester carboxylesterase